MYLKLGSLANVTGDYTSASKYFEGVRARAARLAPEAGGGSIAACSLGVAVGNSRLASHIGELLGKLPPL